ncbi:hypothetical protein GOV12_05825 [Candidatus Pacearchaeota archaeon]|nr:hypothetical protein [Candidatus Pacearchaeota archaeon]
MAKSKENTNKLEKPVWLKYTKKEIEAIIVKLANKDMTAEKIGLTLRDQYGIPKVKLYDIKIKEVMGDKYKDQNTINLNNKIDAITLHNRKYHGDQKAKRQLNIAKANLKKRKEYLESK